EESQSDNADDTGNQTSHVSSVSLWWRWDDLAETTPAVHTESTVCSLRDAVSPGVQAGNRHRQPAGDGRLAEQRVERGALQHRLRPVGDEVRSDARHLAQQIRRS